ncbi:MAG: LPS export ABC transporter periplasmic protein LptC [Steroidobacteraceae bacterium]
MNWRALFFPALIAAAAVLMVLANRPDDSDRDSSAVASATATGFVATQAELVQTDENGRALYQLNADRVIQEMTDGPIQLEQPRVRYRDRNQGNWKLIAASGQLPAQAREIELQGNVQVEGLQAHADQPMTLRTDHLHVDIDKQLATTDAGVQMDWKIMHVNGKGMKLDLPGKQLQLDSDVRGDVVP